MGHNPKSQWKDLANRIEEIITRQAPIFAYASEVERLARKYVKRIINQGGSDAVYRIRAGKAVAERESEYLPDYQVVDVNSTENKERTLFNLRETIVLYDLTNTFLEGTGKLNKKANFGKSKDKRYDCPLVTLGLVLDGDGFPKRSRVFEGNVSEGKTLEKMLLGLEKEPFTVLYTYFGAQYTACILVPSCFGLPSPGLPSDFATDLLAKL